MRDLRAAFMRTLAHLPSSSREAAVGWEETHTDQQKKPHRVKRHVTDRPRDAKLEKLAGKEWYRSIH